MEKYRWCTLFLHIYNIYVYVCIRKAKYSLLLNI